MATSVTHSKVSAIPDGGDANLVRPSDWNAAHVVTVDVADLDTSELTTSKVLHPDGAGGVAWGTDAGAPADATYIVGSANGSLSNETVKAYLKDNYDPDAYPVSPNSLDDEFEGSGAIDAKWTITNNPSAGDAINQTDFPGFAHVGLAENTGTDNYAALVRMGQTPPTGTAAMTFVAKLSMGMTLDAWQTEKGEFASAGIYLGNSTNSEYLFVGFQYNNGQEAALQVVIGLAQQDSGNVTNQFALFVDPTSFLYVKLEKTTANAYTSANTYNFYVSTNGITWQLVGNMSKTFTTACDEVGLMFRRPKSQTGTPKAEAICDWFRRTV